LVLILSLKSRKSCAGASTARTARRRAFAIHGNGVLQGGFNRLTRPAGAVVHAHPPVSIMECLQKARQLTPAWLDFDLRCCEDGRGTSGVRVRSFSNGSLYDIAR
jgi:hypothetical protein